MDFTLVMRLHSFFFWGHASKFELFLRIMTYSVLTVLWGFPLALVQIVIYAKFKTAICILPSNYFGHFIFESDRLISLGHKGSHRTFFTYQPNISNKFFFKILKSKLDIYPRILIVPVYLAHHLLRTHKRFVLKLNSARGLSDADKLADTPPWIRDEILIKRNPLNKCSNTLWFLVLPRIGTFRLGAQRDSQAKKSNYRDVSYLNYEILSQSLASNAEVFLQTPDGGFRNFGRVLEKSRSILKPSHSEAIQFWIASLSDVVISTDSGSSLIGSLFRKPMLQTNLSLFGLFDSTPGVIVTLKKYVNSRDDKLTLRELMDLGVHNITDQKDLDLLGIRIIENSQEDLLLLVSEIEEMAKNCWAPSSENLMVQSLQINNIYLSTMLPREVYFSNAWLKRNLWFFL